MFCIRTNLQIEKYGIERESELFNIPHRESTALAMVLWYHPRLISERWPARFRLGAQKLLSSLFRCYLTD
jgi:hypothetical protein